MRVLHTSDWHLGKRIIGRDRLEEQRAVLSEIAGICERESVDLVLVAGDIFDTFLPSSEAEDLFYSMIKKIAGTSRCVIVISGNHDDAIRLTAAASLAQEQGIYIFGNMEYCPQGKADRDTFVAECGKNYAIAANRRGEQIYLNILPYPNEARLKEDKNPQESFLDKMRRWIQAGETQNTKNLPSVFLSHIFVAGAQVSEGEREIDLGGARAVPLSLLPNCAYTALGHIHKKQHFKNNVYYSGSILQYSFDEMSTQKVVVVFDIKEEGIENLREIQLHAGKKLIRLSADNVDSAVLLLQSYTNCYIELTIYLKEPLLTSQVQELHAANSGLVSIIPVVQNGGSGDAAKISTKTMSSSKLFQEYYKSLYGQEAPKELTELFLEMTEREGADETEIS